MITEKEKQAIEKERKENVLVNKIKAYRAVADFATALINYDILFDFILKNLGFYCIIIDKKVHNVKQNL